MKFVEKKKNVSFCRINIQLILCSEEEKEKKNDVKVKSLVSIPSYACKILFKFWEFFFLSKIHSFPSEFEIKIDIFLFFDCRSLSLKFLVFTHSSGAQPLLWMRLFMCLDAMIKALMNQSLECRQLFITLSGTEDMRFYIFCSTSRHYLLFSL